MQRPAHVLNRRLTAAAAALAAAILPAVPTRAATTLTWDADPATPGAQGGPGAWADAAPGWFNGTTNVNWNNANVDSALFTGTAAGAVNLSGTVNARYLTFDTPGYTLAGGTIGFGLGAGIDSGVHATADVTINSTILTAPGVDGWLKDGPGTLTLGGNNTSGVPFHLKSGTLAFAAKNNPPRSITFDGDVTSRLLYTGGGTSVDVGSSLNVTTVGRVAVPDAATTLNLVAEIRGAGTLITEGAGTFAPTYATTLFTGSVSVQGGTFLLRSAGLINARPIQLTGGTLALAAPTATDFGSPVTARVGPGTVNLVVGSNSAPAPGTSNAHTLPVLSVISGTLNVTSAGGWRLQIPSVTNSGTIDLNNTHLTITSALAPFSNSTGTIRFAHAAPGTSSASGAIRGLWFNTASGSTPGNTTVTSTFAGQTDDADLLVGAAGSGTVATNLTLDGSWRGGGGSATSTLVLPRFGNIALGPNARVNTLPTDPAAAPRPFRIWGTGNTPGGTLTFDPAFVADRTASGPAAEGLASIELSNVVWETQHSQNLPAVTRTLPGSAATFRTGQITFDNFSNPSAYNSWTVKTNDQTYDGGVNAKFTASILLNKNLTLTGRVTPYADNHLRVAANRTLSVGGTNVLTLSGDLGFAPGSSLTGGTALLAINTDPGAGWYDGNYARNPTAGTVTPPPAPAHTLKLSFGDLEGHGGAIFNAPVTRLAELSIGNTARVSLSLPAGPQKVLSVANKLSTFSSQFFTRHLDLTDNAMILGASTFQTPTTVRTLLTSGTLRSSATDADHALGYARAADVLPPGPAATYSFLSLPATANDVLLRYTVRGDANIDGRVNFDDLLALAKHYNATTNIHWSTGDFNYDNTINFDDLLLLAKHYNAALPTTPLPGASPEFSSDLAAAFAHVPEPSTLAGLAACGLALITRRKRRRHV